jgi:hypothetical protein
VRPELTDRSIVVSSGRQTTADLGSGVAVLNLETKVYFTLNGTSRRIWEMLCEPVRVGELIERLIERFDVEPARCRREVLDLLEKLAAQGLVDIDSEPALPGR